ncbi:MAG: helix-turn-helix domain-containing protein, partial [Pseudonocardiaceae bacterium]
MPMAELAELLTGVHARRALARRDITTVFRVLRDAGVSQISIARATGQKQSEISEIIAGRQVQSVAVLARIAEGLGMPRGWMGLAYLPDYTPVQVPPDELGTAAESAANLLRHAGQVLWGSPVFGAAEPIRVQNIPTPVPRRISSADVARVTATTERLGRLLGDLGGIPLTAPLTAHARASEALLGASAANPVRHGLLIALSDAHKAAGSAAAGAGLEECARQHFIRGMDCASEGGDLRRAAIHVDNLGSLERPRAPNEALKLFQLGAAAALTRLTRAMLEYHCAYSLALLSLEADALAALRRAGDSLRSAGDESRLWEGFATALPHIEGCTYYPLGRFDRAAPA